jgi:acetyl esterase
MPIFELLSHARLVWFSIDYRLAPRFPFPAAIEDVDLAIEYAQAITARFKMDTNRIALLGRR